MMFLLLRPAVLLAFAAMFYGTILATLLTRPLDCDDSRPTRLTQSSVQGSLSSSAESLSYRLASEQSLGFFNDIVDADWKLRQLKARRSQNHQFPHDPLRGTHRAPAAWYSMNYEPKFTCPHIERVGGLGDGPKWTCDPHRLPEQAAKRDCVIYSVGSAGKFEWELGLIDLVGTVCEIHIFDPGNYYKEWMDEKNIHYHQWGLKSSYMELDGNMPKRLRLKTLNETIEELGHVGKVVDIFKVDCEFCEWYSFQDWVNSAADIRQILLETHNIPRPKTTEWWPFAGTKIAPNELFDALENANYLLYSKEPNIDPGRAQGNGVEWAYIKMHPDFLHGQ